MATLNLKEIQYDNSPVLVEAARKALAAKTDAAGNVITTTYATKAEIGQLKNLEPLFVEELPETGDSKYLYFVPKTGTAGDSYNEYIWVNTSSSYELIGNSQIDISGKLDKLTTSGTHVYSHNGSTQGEIAVDSTSGGTASSDSLITSGAVNAGLATKQASSTVLTSVAGQSSGTGLLKLTNGVASLDTNSYALSSDIKVSATDVTIDW